MLNAPIEYRERGRTKVATYRELILKLLVDRAISGDLDAAETGSQNLGSRGALRRPGPRPDSGGELDRRLSWSNRRPENRRSRGRARRHACRMVVVVGEMIERANSRCPFHRAAHGRRISLGQLHLGQLKAHWALQPHRFKALRCGRRFGKTEFAKNWIAQGLVQGEECAWFAPQHMTWIEVYSELTQMLGPILDTSSRAPPVIRLSNGGRLDFWSLENPIAGRGRRYRRIVIDEAAFTKDGDNRSERFHDGALGKGHQADPIRLRRRGADLLEFRRQEPG